MIHKKIAGLLLMLLPAMALLGQNIDLTSSIVNFKIGNLGGANTVKGSFTGMKGKLSFNPDNLSNSQFEVCVAANTVNTENKKRDKHLRNEDFFEVEKYPTICFSSSNITKKGDTFLTTRTLSMHGVSKTIEIPFTYDGQNFKGALALKRLDYKVGPKSGFMVGKEVELEIICTIK